MLVDTRHAWHVLRRSPGHFVTAVLCLTIALAVCIAAFSAMMAAMFGDLPGVTDRRTLALVFLDYGDGSLSAPGGSGRTRLSTLDVDVFARFHGPAFRGVAAEGLYAFQETRDTHRRFTRGAFVSGDYFAVLGTRPAKGRLLSARDADAGAPAAAVIGYDYWMLLLGGRTDVVGLPLVLGQRTFTIVGVAPRRFTGMLVGEPGRRWFEETQIWVPLHFASEFPGTPTPGVPWHNVAARLAAGRRLSDARRVAGLIATRIEAAQPATRRHASLVLFGHGIDPMDYPALALGAAALFMLLPLAIMAVACANVANLQLARATERIYELTVRLALGASRVQLIRPLALEAVLLTLVAAVLGWGLAAYGLHAIADLSPIPLRLDRTVFVFSTLLVAVVVFFSGCAPAWVIARRCAAAGLRHTPHAAGRAHQRLRNALVAVQVALSVVLIFVTAVALRSLSTIAATAPSHASEVAIVRLNLGDLDVTTVELRRILDATIQRLSADPRVFAAGVADVMSDRGVRFWLANDPAGVRRLASGGVVSPSWFKAVGAAPIAGRLPAQGEATTPTVVVSSELAELAGPDAASVIGRRLKVQRNEDGPIETVEVVGVIGNPLPSLEGRTPPALYLPMGDTVPAGASLFFRARARVSVLGSLRPMLAAIHPRLQWTAAYTLETFMKMQGVPMRYLALVFGGLGVLGLLLAVAGLYAVTSYVVSLRTSEIGIRIALGARPSDVAGMVFRQAIRVVAYGTVAGFLVALPLTFAMRAVFFRVAPADPVAVCETLALFAVAAFVAAALPARRAVAIEPVTAIRDE